MDDISVNLIDQIIEALNTAKKAHDFLPPLPPDLKPVHLRVLGAIYRIRDKDGNCRVSDINRSLDFLLPNTTKFIADLVHLNVVKKYTPASDKRVVLIHTTELGEQYIHIYIAKYQELLTHEISLLNQSDCITMIDTIQKVYRVIKTVYQK